MPGHGVWGLGGFQALQAFLGNPGKAGMKLSQASSGALLLPFWELLEIRAISGFSSVLLSKSEALVYTKILDLGSNLKKEVCAGRILNCGLGVCVNFGDVHEALSYCYALAYCHYAGGAKESATLNMSLLRAN